MAFALTDKAHLQALASQGRLAWPLACLLTLSAWMLAGLMVHAPWKPDEAYSFGLVEQLLQTHDWIVPHLAGEPFLEKPPLYYLTAALTAQLFSPLLPLPDGARLVNILYLTLAVVFTGLTAKTLYGRNALLAPVILIGAPGLLLPAHLLITDVALFAGFAVALYGLAIFPIQPVRAGLCLGCGAGITFMTKGLFGPGVLALSAVLLPLLLPAWRNRRYARMLAIALVTLLPWITIWPIALYLRSPALFTTWFWTNNLGRFFGFAHLGPHNPPGYYFRLLWWYAFPALPLALCGLWQKRRELTQTASLLVPLTLFLVLLAILSLAADSRELYAMPTLIPLALLAAGTADQLPKRPLVAIDWLSKILFSTLAVLLWVTWAALFTGYPVRLSAWLAGQLPGFIHTFSRVGFVTALSATLLWGLSLRHPSSIAPMVLESWAAGLALTWVLASSLWLAPVDWLKSYQPLATALQQHLPANRQCIASWHLGEGQRALLAHYARIVTRRLEVQAHPGCPFLLVQDTGSQRSAPGPGWRQIWEGSRPADHSERYHLYQRSMETPAK